MTVSRIVTLPRCLILLVLFALPTVLRAQSLVTANRPSEIAVTGGYVYGEPKYGPDHMQGVSLGAMFTRYFRFPVAPSIEARINVASTPYNKETSYVGGIRLQGEVFHRFHPYGDFLGGGGIINFKFPNPANYTSDNSVVYSFGGGVGVDVFRNIQLTADYQYQSWDLGGEHGVSEKFNPTLATIGIKYVIPFKSYVGSSYHRRKDDAR